MEYIYFNNASTTPINQEVMNVIIDTLQENWANPNDNYSIGKESKKIIDKSRSIVAEKINANPDEIIFTSGGSAANALALNGGDVVATAYEHSSIINNYNSGNIIFPNKDGFIDMESFRKIQGLIGFEFPDLISVMAANNELGTINDIKSITKYVHNHQTLMHTDATQYFPYKQIDVKDWDIDLMTITSGHKIYAPAGIGALYVKRGTRLKSLISGSQEKGLFAGTENVAYIAAFAKAVELIDYDKSIEIAQLRDYFEDEIIRLIPKCFINCQLSERAPHISNICIRGCDAETLQMMLDMDHIYVSTGSACNSYDQEASHVLKAIGMTEPNILSCLRFSFGLENTYEQIDYAIKCLKKNVEFLRDI